MQAEQRATNYGNEVVGVVGDRKWELTEEVNIKKINKKILAYQSY